MGETGHPFSASSCLTMQCPWSTCPTTIGLTNISKFAVSKLKIILFFVGSECGSDWSSLKCFSMLNHEIQLIVEIYCWDWGTPDNCTMVPIFDKPFN